MRIRRVVLQHFRNHTETIFTCSPGMNIFLGKNGEGKTNALEGLSYLCLSKSFFSATDGLVTEIGAAGFGVTGTFFSDSGIEFQSRIEYNKEKNSKTIFINNGRLEKSSALVGMFPLVVLSPDQHAITLGAPSDRRKFLDLAISQSNKLYLENLLEYRKILRQRNKILTDHKATREDPAQALEPWNESLARVGVAVMQKRREFIREFQPYIRNAYSQVARVEEYPSVSYVPSFQLSSDDTSESMRHQFERNLLERAMEERFSGHTQVGPHRDEIGLSLSGLEMRGYASQGQHKTMLVALKLAEFMYLKEHCHETPILLLDDVLGELDESRAQALIEMTSDLGQIFMTSTDERSLDLYAITKAAPKKIFIHKGRVDRVEETIH